MPNVRIITHSGCDLSFEEAEKHHVIMIPDIVVFGEEQLKNNVDILPEEFYRRIRGGELPTSAHPSPGDFMDAYEQAEDCEDIIFIAATSKMTGTMSTASVAASLMEDDGPRIHVFDSRQVSYGQAILVLKAADMAESGYSAQEILDALEEMVPRIGVYFVMDTLSYARKGGRLGAIKALTADALGVKPLLVFGDGTVSDISLNFSFRDGIRSIFKMYRKYYREGTDIFIFHADNLAGATQLRDLILAENPELC